MRRKDLSVDRVREQFPHLGCSKPGFGAGRVRPHCLGVSLGDDVLHPATGCGNESSLTL